MEERRTLLSLSYGQVENRKHTPNRKDDDHTICCLHIDQVRVCLQPTFSCGRAATAASAFYLMLRFGNSGKQVRLNCAAPGRSNSFDPTRASSAMTSKPPPAIRFP